MAIPTEEDIKRATSDIGKDKELGPDGLNATFYQTFWYLTGPDIVKMV